MNLLSIIFLFVSLPYSGVDTDAEYRAEATYQVLISSADYLSPGEKAMLWEINLVRTEPSAYIPYVEEELTKVINDSVRLSAIVSESIKRRVTTVDGVEIIEVDTTYRNYYQDRVSAIRELLIELGDAVPMPGLRPSQALYEVALNHASSQVTSNYIDHVGIDGSWPQDRILRADPDLTDGNENIARGIGSPRQIVIQLLIDSGVATRGHRKNILNPDWKYVNCHHARQLDESSLKWWVQEFAY